MFKVDIHDIAVSELSLLMTKPWDPIHACALKKHQVSQIPNHRTTQVLSIQAVIAEGFIIE
jgi:hypothetical protein